MGGRGSSSSPRVMTEEEYLSSKGYAFMGYSEAGMHIGSQHVSERQKRQQINLVQEIICLRNHYVHAGYYIKNNRLYIRFGDINDKIPDPRDYVSKVDFDWIYTRSKILYKIVIDIIFKEILQYKDYKYSQGI